MFIPDVWGQVFQIFVKMTALTILVSPVVADHHRIRNRMQIGATHFPQFVTKIDLEKFSQPVVIELAHSCRLTIGCARYVQLPFTASARRVVLIVQFRVGSIGDVLEACPDSLSWSVMQAPRRGSIFGITYNALWLTNCKYPV